MPEPESLDELLHIQRESMKTIELEERSLVSAEAEPQSSVSSVVLDVRQTLQRIVEQITKISSHEPELLFQQAISSISALDAHRFVVENLLEALKRGDDIRKAINRFKDLGLISGESGDSQGVPAEDGKRATTVLQKLKGACMRGMTSLMNLSAAALRRIPKWLDIEPQIQVLPFPALTFSLKGKSMDHHDLLESILMTLRRMEAQAATGP